MDPPPLPGLRPTAVFGVLMTPPECVDCRAADDRPARPRVIDPRSGPRKPRCATHYRLAKNARKARAHNTYVQRTYGLTEGQYWELYEAQGRKCAIPRCRATGKVKRLAVDHDHETGEVRGLLCGPHNYELVGKYAGDLRDALDYLADPPARRLRGVA